jgi:hypothetical protein
MLVMDSCDIHLPDSCYLLTRQMSVVDVFQLILQSLAHRNIARVWPFSAPQWHHFCYFLSHEPNLVFAFPALEEFDHVTAQEISFFCMLRRVCIWSPDGQTILLIEKERIMLMPTQHPQYTTLADIEPFLDDLVFQMATLCAIYPLSRIP